MRDTFLALMLSSATLVGCAEDIVLCDGSEDTRLEYLRIPIPTNGIPDFYYQKGIPYLKIDGDSSYLTHSRNACLVDDGDEWLYFPNIQGSWTLNRAGQLDPSQEEWVLDHIDVARWTRATTDEMSEDAQCSGDPTWWQALGNEAYCCNCSSTWDRQTDEVRRVVERLIYEGHPVASTALDVTVSYTYDLDGYQAKSILSNERTWRVPWESPLDPTSIGDTWPTEFWESWFPYSTLTSEDATWFHETRMAYLAKDRSLYNDDSQIYAIDEERGLLVVLLIRDNFEVGTPFEVEEPGGGYTERNQPDPSKWE